MKVIKVYDKNSDIRCYNKNVFRATESILAQFPYEYGDCYRHNLETLELIYVDKMIDPSLDGYYNTEANVITFNNKGALGHEMFHMASNDLVNGNYAFESKMKIEAGLLEGMTEYFNMKAYNMDGPSAYPFEVFCVSMLEDIPNIFRPYFIPNSKDFIKLFPNRRDIYSLLYSLDAYNDMYLQYLEELYANQAITVDMNSFKDTIKDVFNNLVAIELSMVDDSAGLRKYGHKFMEYVGSDRLMTLFQEFYPKYYEYADKLIDKKIRKRKI